MSGWALVYHCPMVENIVNVKAGHWCSLIHCPMSWLGIGVSLPNGREHSQCQVGHWCIIAQW